MKIIVTHTSPDWDAITSVWLLKKFLPDWHDAVVEFVPAGERFAQGASRDARRAQGDGAIEMTGEDEVIHVDTGLGPLDHHQTDDKNVSAAGLTWGFVRRQKTEDGRRKAEDRRRRTELDRWKVKEEAAERIVKIVVDTDHFKEVFWENPTADYHEFSLLGVLEGLKLYKQNQDEYYVEFGIECLEALLHNFENRIWAEKEIVENSVQFKTKWGKGIGFETINDTVLKLAQKMGYVVTVRKDPRKGYVRIKAKPEDGRQKTEDRKQKTEDGIRSEGVDLTSVYSKLKELDPQASWYLHVSKKMLLNGTAKNPKMKATKLGLGEIIKVLEES